MDAIKQTVKQYLLDEFLPGEDPENLKPDTPLISGGILDSLATLRLVAFLEEQFGVTFEAHEAGVDYLDTVAQIATIVQSKLTARADR